MNTREATSQSALEVRKFDFGALGCNGDMLVAIKDQIAKNASDAELYVFLQTAKRLGLDPFARQIYLVERWDSKLSKHVKTTQVSIDGFRLVAERSTQYEGQGGPWWCGEDGKWTDVWLLAKPPVAAKVEVYRTGFRAPISSIALWKSYAAKKKDGTLMPMWAQFPEVMLAKCAEALALRKAFPNCLAGVYASEEMEQSVPGAHEPEPAKLPKAKPVSDATKNELWKLIGEAHKAGSLDGNWAVAVLKEMAPDEAECRKLIKEMQAGDLSYFDRPELEVGDK